MIELSDRQVEFLREVHHLNPRYSTDKHKSLMSAVLKHGLVKLVDGKRMVLTNKGFDALSTHHVIERDEKWDRWAITFRAYLKKFSVSGLFRLFKDTKHDMLYLLNPNFPGADEMTRLGCGSFDRCPLSYVGGSPGSFNPDPDQIEHTQNSFVEFWDSTLRDGAWLQKMDLLTSMVELIRGEIKRRDLREPL